jgi:hypothetical protein
VGWGNDGSGKIVDGGTIMRRQGIEVVSNRVGKGAGAGKSRGVVVGGTVKNPSGGSDRVVEIGGTGGAVTELPARC